jgi:hypothetical protein
LTWEAGGFFAGVVGFESLVDGVGVAEETFVVAGLESESASVDTVKGAEECVVHEGHFGGALGVLITLGVVC